ncbi:PLAC8-domain-containing protein [Lactarius pseudohatsudake]|nr:PLAC8-domain-containing protein [Lactarius pseudohatsudake]
MSGNAKEPISSQPQGTAPMAQRGNKNTLNREVGADGQRNWSSQLCGCSCPSGSSGLAICCLAMWCPGVVFGRNKQRLRHLQSQGTPLPGGGTYVNGDCAVYCCLAGPRLSWILGIGERTDIRARYSIRGSTFEDRFTSWCCTPCALVQEHREISLEETTFY